MMKKLLKSAYILLAPMLLSANIGVTSEPDADGVITYTQIINENSDALYRTYEGVEYDRFDVYGGKDSDFGWKHTFPDYNLSDLNIVSAQLLISAYDVDAEPEHGENGEYNQISIDHNNLNPGFLQGTNQTTYETKFDIPLNYITDDGEMSVFMDVDTREKGWWVSVPQSTVVIKYKIVADNTAPYKVKVKNVLKAFEDTPLVVEVEGSDVEGVDSNQLDPDNNNVSYKYRWYVDVGQGEYIDTDFAGKGVLNTNTVAAEKVKIAEKWRAEVTPVDEKGAMGISTIYDFPTIEAKDSDNDSIRDIYEEYDNDPERAFNLYYPAKDKMNTLLFEDTWPNTGDYDMNDVVMGFNYKFVTNANNLVKDIYLTLDFKAYGGLDHHGFALEIADLDRTNIASITTVSNGKTVELTSEEGHKGDKTVIVIAKDLTKYMATTYKEDGNHIFFNTQSDVAEEATQELVLHIELDEAQALDISKAPFNPFIFKQFNNSSEPSKGRGQETHLIDHAPSDLADLTFFGTKDDVSVFTSSDTDTKTTGQFYRTKDGLPWALEIPGNVSYASEQVDFLNAYPDLFNWAKTGGGNNTDWYQHKNSQYTWKNK